MFQGAGKAFVAGADIRYFVEKIKAGRIPDIVDFTRKGHELLLRIEESKKLTIALLDGLSLGGGSELALACQAIVATPAGSMAFPETGIGIFPGLGGMLRLARHVGPELAKYYVFSGVPISAADAHALGIVHRLVAPAEVDAAMRVSGRRRQAGQVSPTRDSGKVQAPGRHGVGRKRSAPAGRASSRRC
ncbi:MAG: enoyl-CoA hydratase/isomerase family protein [Deltaproteobacteria bacterium]|nr:enoyl-CoA hydratase/isomerase family protein [Deltaproteobacteria bacterium]